MMTIADACAAIMGRSLAKSIIDSMGIHWAVVAAMAQATTDDDPAAIEAIRQWNADAKEGGR